MASEDFEKIERYIEPKNVKIDQDYIKKKLKNSEDNVVSVQNTYTSITYYYPSKTRPGEIESYTKSGGSANLRTNNPGNIVANSNSRNWEGVIGTRVDPEGREFLVFKDFESGHNAARKLLNSDQYLNAPSVPSMGFPQGSIGAAIYKWAPPSDGNDVGAYVADIKRITGHDPQTNLSNLSQGERDKVLAAIYNHEGHETPNIVNDQQIENLLSFDELAQQSELQNYALREKAKLRNKNVISKIQEQNAQTQAVKEFLESDNFEPNILDCFDNPAYRIQWKVFAEQDMKKVVISDNNIKEKDWKYQMSMPGDSVKVNDPYIIFDSAITTSSTIEHLEINSTVSATAKTKKVFVTQMSFELNEPNGYLFFDRLRYLLGNLGYMNHNNVLFYFLITFEGKLNDSANGNLPYSFNSILDEPNYKRIIPFYITDVQTKVDYDGCHHRVKCAAYSSGIATSKEFFNFHKELELSNGVYGFREIIEKIIHELNEQAKETSLADMVKSGYLPDNKIFAVNFDELDAVFDYHSVDPEYNDNMTFDENRQRRNDAVLKSMENNGKWTSTEKTLSMVNPVALGYIALNKTFKDFTDKSALGLDVTNDNDTYETNKALRNRSQKYNSEEAKARRQEREEWYENNKWASYIPFASSFAGLAGYGPGGRSIADVVVDSQYRDSTEDILNSKSTALYLDGLKIDTNIINNSGENSDSANYVIKPGVSIEKVLDDITNSLNTNIELQVKQGHNYMELNDYNKTKLNFKEDFCKVPCFFRWVPEVEYYGQIYETDQKVFRITYRIERYYEPSLIMYKPKKADERTSDVMKFINSELGNPIRKKYQYIFTSKNTNILSLDINLDMVWWIKTYDNIALRPADNSATKVDENSIANYYLQNPYMLDDYVNEKLELKTVRPEAQQQFIGQLNVAAKQLYKQELLDLSVKTPVEYSNEYTLFDPMILKGDICYDMPEMSPDAVNRNDVKARSAFNQLYDAGNMVILDMTIRGDPYWLTYNSEVFRSSPSFVFEMNTPSNFRNDGEMERYSYLRANSLFGVYEVIEIKHIFDQGVFTQKLKSKVNLNIRVPV